MDCSPGVLPTLARGVSVDSGLYAMQIGFSWSVVFSPTLFVDHLVLAPLGVVELCSS